MSDMNISTGLHILARSHSAKAFGTAAVVWFGLTGVTQPVSASTTNQIEVVATVEVVHGFLNKYNVGLSFTNASDCNAKIGQLNLVLQNLHAQGVTKGNKSITLSCEQTRFVTVQ